MLRLLIALSLVASVLLILSQVEFRLPRVPAGPTMIAPILVSAKSL